MSEELCSIRPQKDLRGNQPYTEVPYQILVDFHVHRYDERLPGISPGHAIENRFRRLAAGAPALSELQHDRHSCGKHGGHLDL